MSATERLKVWLNQKIAEILGDLQEREPVENPRPTRACCRIIFMVILLMGFSSLLVYNFINAPDTRVVQIPYVTDGGKNYAFPGCFLHNRTSPGCTKWSKSKFPKGIPVSCPCTNTSFPWIEFVKFYALHENSTVRKMDFPGFTKVSPPGVGTQHDEVMPTHKPSPGSQPKITLPDLDTVFLGNDNVVQDKKNLTAEDFCNLSYLWPFANSTVSPGKIVFEAKKVSEDQFLHDHCIWMATLLFPGSYEDHTRSIRSLNTQSLLDWEGINTLFARLGRDAVLARRLDVDMALPVNVDNEDFRRSYNALARLLTRLLDREEKDPSRSQNYVYRAKELSYTLNFTQLYDKNAIVWILKDDSGPIFLQPEIRWEAYRQKCLPEYCEVTMPMGGAQKLYWVSGISGGVATIVLAIVTTVLWPCTATLLLWISERSVAAILMLLRSIQNAKLLKRG